MVVMQRYKGHNLVNLNKILHRALDKLWYQKKLYCAVWLLVPFSWVFEWIVRCRCFLYQHHIFPQFNAKIPLIVVGNLTVGGNGKTPLVLAITEHLQNRGFKVGIVTRGYKGQHRRPMRVDSQSDPLIVGDEPCMIAQKLSCPIVVGKNRVEALKYLLSLDPKEPLALDYIISDDGLQHYALGRSLEIVVIDAKRQFGNGYCLPAGPLREPISRLFDVDLIVYNDRAESSSDDSHRMLYQMGACYQALDKKNRQPLSAFKDQKIHAIAGLGYPEPFFQQLTAMGLEVIPHAYPDHHHYQASDLYFHDDLPIILTEKDWVKCQSFMQVTHWVLPIQAVLSSDFYQHLDRLMQEKTSNG